MYCTVVLFAYFVRVDEKYTFLMNVWRYIYLYDSRDIYIILYERHFFVLYMGLISFFFFLPIPSVYPPVRRALKSNKIKPDVSILKGVGELRRDVAAHGGIEQNDGAWGHHQGGSNVRSEHLGDGRRVGVRALDHGQPSDHGTDEYLEKRPDVWRGVRRHCKCHRRVISRHSGMQVDFLQGFARPDPPVAPTALPEPVHPSSRWRWGLPHCQGDWGAWHGEDVM